MEDEEWGRETVEYLKNNTQLSYTQIYKWGWDQKKKVQNNPNGKMVPSIDEFGGYCKFDAESKNTKLTKVLDVDWNEKIRQLDLECELEEKLRKTKSEPNPKNYNPIEMKNSYQENAQNTNEVVVKLNINNDDDAFCTPPKKTKRERYSSDITNATNSGRNLISNNIEDSCKMNYYVTPFLEDLEKDFSFDNYHFESFENFRNNGFMINSDMVSVSLNSINIILSGNFKQTFYRSMIRRT